MRGRKSQMASFPCVFLCVALLCACSRNAGGVEKASPDGGMLAKAWPDERGIVVFSIFSSDGEKLYEERATGASAYQKWSIKWLDGRRLLLDSSDIGSRIWTLDEKGVWRSSSPNEANSPDGRFLAYVFSERGGKGITLEICEPPSGKLQGKHALSRVEASIEVANCVDSLSWPRQDEILVRDKSGAIHKLGVSGSRIMSVDGVPCGKQDERKAMERSQ